MNPSPYQPLPVNGFRRDLLAGKTLIGCWSSFNSPYTAEILGLAGFDWLLLDGEHAPNDVTTFIPQLMALKDSSSAPVVRPPWNDTVIIKRLLDAGFYNLLVPFIESADEARRAVAATRYPPQGVRGVGTSHRSNRYGTAPGYFESINDNITVLLQIESRKGIAAIDSIAAVGGVDGIFIGPSDLSASLGHLGQPNHPEVQAAIHHLFERTRAHGKAVGTLTPNHDEAQRYIDMGMHFVAVGSDQGVFRSATQALRDRFMPRKS
jgi:2-dehydro-3-deoxyglucarate aldolase